MDFWFSEMQTPNVKLSIRIDRQLYSGKSEFQRIDVFDSPEFGRFLTLDGYMMLTWPCCGESSPHWHPVCRPPEIPALWRCAWS